MPTTPTSPTPGPLAALLRRAHQHRAAGEWPAAMALYRQCLNDNPQSLDTLHNHTGV